MATKSKAKGSSKAALPLPGSVAGFLNRDQVCEALGGISIRRLYAMMATGAFPKPDVHLGNDGKRLPRWSVVLVNGWCAEAAKRGSLGVLA